MAKSPGIRVDGLREFRQELVAADPKWTKALTDAHKKVALRAVDWAQYSAAGSGTRQQQMALDRIKGRGFPERATIGVYNAGATQYALGAFYGAKKRFGWYGAPKYGGSQAKQFPKWVGNTWDVGGDGGPYHINSSLRDHIGDIEAFFLEVIDKATRSAFPD